MPTERRNFIVIEVLLGILAIFCAVMLVRGNVTPKMKKIAVILDDSEGEEWNALKHGMREAALEEGITLDFVGTDHFETVAEEEEVCKAAIEDGAEGLVVYPFIGNDGEELTAGSVPYVAVKSRNASFPVVEADNYAMGESLAQAILEDYSGNLEAKKVGFILNNKNDEAESERLRGIQDALENSGYKTLWFFGSEPTKTVNQISDLTKEVDIIIALDDGSLSLAGELSSNRKLHGAVVYGIGNSASNFYYLDTEAIRAITVPDMFQMGYHSIMSISKLTSFPSRKPGDTVVKYKTLRQKDLFLPKNQEVLYGLGLNS